MNKEWKKEKKNNSNQREHQIDKIDLLWQKQTHINGLNISKAFAIQLEYLEQINENGNKHVIEKISNEK